MSTTEALHSAIHGGLDIRTRPDVATHVLEAGQATPELTRPFQIDCDRRVISPLSQEVERGV